MVELTPIEQLVIKTLQNLGATEESRMKTSEEVEKKSDRPKGQINSTLMNLVNKGLVKRKVREKAAGYYLIKQA